MNVLVRRCHKFLNTLQWHVAIIWLTKLNVKEFKFVLPKQCKDRLMLRINQGKDPKLDLNPRACLLESMRLLSYTPLLCLGHTATLTTPHCRAHQRWPSSWPLGSSFWSTWWRRWERKWGKIARSCIWGSVSCPLWNGMACSKWYKILKLSKAKNTSEAMLVFLQVFLPSCGWMRRSGKFSIW